MGFYALSDGDVAEALKEHAEQQFTAFNLDLQATDCAAVTAETKAATKAYRNGAVVAGVICAALGYRLYKKTT